MKLKSNSALCILLTLTFLVGLIPVINVAGQARPKVYIDPAVNIFFTDETAVGATFKISIKAADWAAPGVFSHQLTFKYDNAMLEAVEAEIPEGHLLTPSIKPGNIFVVDSGTINQDAGTVSFGVTLLAPEEGKIGGGTLATVTLKITAAPSAGQKLTSTLGFAEVIMVDPDANPIPPANYDVVTATFEYATPPPPWYLKIEPSIVAASKIGDEVTINVTLKDAAADGKISGIQFRILYPGVLTTNVDLISEGPFVKSFGETFFQAYVEPTREGEPSVLAFTLLLPSELGQPPEQFPDGSGTLATITFRVVNVPAQLTTYPFTLTDVLIVDPDANVLPYRRLENGAIMLPTKPEDLNEDGKVDIVDMTIWAVAFGSNPTKPRWNQKADINRDDKVNILDGVFIAKSFGFTA